MQDSLGMLGPVIVPQPLTLAIGAIAFAFCLWMLVERLRRKDQTDGEKIAGTLAILPVTGPGATISFFAGNRGRRRFP